MSLNSTTGQHEAIMPMAQADGIMFTLYSVAVFTTLLRLYCRGVVLRALGLDDALITIGVLIGAATVAYHHLKLQSHFEVYNIIINDPTFLRDADASLSYRRTAIKYSFAQAQFYVLGLGFIKLSILAFLHRIVVGRKHVIPIYIVAFCIAGYTLAYNLTKTVQCKPIAACWDPSVPFKGVRIDVQRIDISNSGLQTLFDIALLIIPISIMSQLNTNRKAKVGLIALFSLGIFGLAATIVRLPSYTIWTQVEINVAAMCANAPALWTLTKWLLQGRTLTKPSPMYEKDRTGGSGSGKSASHQQVGQKGVHLSSVSCGRKKIQEDLEDDNAGITRKTEFRLDIEAGKKEPVYYTHETEEESEPRAVSS